MRAMLLSDECLSMSRLTAKPRTKGRSRDGRQNLRQNRLRRSRDGSQHLLGERIVGPRTGQEGQEGHKGAHGQDRQDRDPVRNQEVRMMLTKMSTEYVLMFSVTTTLG